MEKTNEDFFLAIPKKGRLSEPIIQRLYQAGFNIHRQERSDLATVENFKQLKIFFLPARDIAKFIDLGDVDLGITGSDVILESNANIVKLLEFEFGKCRLCIQAPKDKYTSIKQLAGCRIATSFPELTKKYLKKINLNPLPEIRIMTGSVEVACQLGFADAVVDLVESGKTMQKAGLIEIEEIHSSKPNLIVNPKSKNKYLINIIKERLKGVEIAAQYSVIEYNIKKVDLYKGEKITPGLQSPTVMQLEDKDWVAVKATILKSHTNKIMDDLQNIGATAILIYSLTTCRF